MVVFYKMEKVQWKSIHKKMDLNNRRIIRYSCMTAKPSTAAFNTEPIAVCVSVTYLVTIHGVGKRRYQHAKERRRGIL